MATFGRTTKGVRAGTTGAHSVPLPLHRRGLTWITGDKTGGLAWVGRWPDLPPVLCFVLIAIVPVTWFRGDYFVSAGDFSWPFDRLKYMHVATYAWDASVSTGYAATRQVAALPFAVLAGLTQRLNIAGPAFEQLMFAFWFGSTGLSMYVLARVIGLSRLAAVGAGLFYTFNTFALITVWSISGGILMPFSAFLPLHLALFMSCYRGRRGLTFALPANLLLLLSTMTLSFTNPALPALMWGVAAAWVVYDITTEGINRRMLLSAMLFATSWVVINAFWILPLISSIRQQVGLAANASISDVDTFRLDSVQIDGALRLSGLWSLYLGNGPDPYYPWARGASAAAFKALGFISPILMGIALVRGSARQRYIPFFGLLFLIGVGLVALPFLPGGLQLIGALDTHAPSLLRAFRGGFLKFGFFLPLGAAPLVGMGLEEIFRAACRFVSVLGGAACWTGAAFLIYGVLVFPFWTGDVIAVGGHQYLPSWRVRLPQAYYRLKAMTESMPQRARLLALPLPDTYNLDYTWGRDAEGRLQGYNGGDFTRWMSDWPVIYNVGVDQSGFIAALANGVDSFSSLGTLNRTLGLLNVGAVLLHKDMNLLTDYQVRTHVPAMAKLNGQLRSHLLNFGPFSIYRVPSQYVLPLVYAARVLVDSGSTTSDFFRILHDPGLAAFGASAYAPLTVPTELVSENRRRAIAQTLKTIKVLGQPTWAHGHLVVHLIPPRMLTFRRVNPTEYDVTVSGNRRSPFLLVLDEQFDPGWHAYIVPSSGTGTFLVSCDHRQVIVSQAAPVGQCLERTTIVGYQQLADSLRQPIPAARHFPANGFANGWVIMPQDAPNRSTFTIVLEYTPQRLVLASFSVTLFTAGVALIMGVILLRSQLLGRHRFSVNNSPLPLARDRPDRADSKSDR